MRKLLLLLIPSFSMAFDTFESERYLYAYMRFTKEIKRMSSNIPLNQNDPEIIQDLKFELKSCGISSTTNSCLNSKFKSVKSLESFNNENLEGTRFLLKAFSKDLYDQSFFIQVMTIHAEFAQVQVDRVELFKESVPLTDEGFKSFFEKYLRNEGNKLFETTEFFPHDITRYLELAHNSENSLEIFHSITSAKGLDSEKAYTEEINNILRNKFEIILNTQAPLYQIEFLSLFETLVDLKKELAQKYFQSTDQAAKRKSAIVLANLGVTDPQVKEALVSIIKTSINYHDQLDALNGLFKIRNTLDDEILILQMIKSGNPEVSKKAFELSNQIKFSEEHLIYLAAELSNPSPEYQVFMLDFLSKINTPKSTKIILEKLDDLAEPVTKKAFQILKDRNLDNSDFHKIKKFLKTLKDFTKFYCLQLLDKDKSEDISFLILDHLTDLFPKVEELAVQLMMGREITPKVKKELWRMVGKKKTKIYSLRILSKLETAEVTSLLINELKEVEPDDLMGLFEIIKKRNLDSSNYVVIKGLYNSKEPRVRTFAIKLLTKFPDKNTLDFLKSAHLKETDRVVKATIVTLIKYLEDKLFPKPPVPVEPTVQPPVEPTVQPPVEPTVQPPVDSV